MRKSIVPSVVLSLVGVATLFLGSVAAIAYGSYARTQRNELRNAHRIFADQLATSLVLPIWNFDRPQIDQIVESAMRDRNVYGVVVRPKDVRSTVHARARDANGAVAVVGEVPSAAGLLAETRDVIADGETIGTATVFVTPAPLDAMLRRHALTILGTIAALGVVLFLAVYGALWRFVLKPLKEVEAYAADVSSGDLEKTNFGWRRFHGEIDGLRNSLERMVGLLDARYRELRLSQVQLTTLKTYLSNIIDSMPSLLVGMDSDAIVTQWNRHAARVTGIAAKEAVGRPVRAVLPEFAAWIEDKRRHEGWVQPAAVENMAVERGGVLGHYSLVLYPLTGEGSVGAVVRIEDVSERTRTQELMIQTEKMMSLGGLAAGMAHEINNPLGIIAQSAQNIERRFSPDLPANRESADAMGIDLHKMQRYLETRQILSFLAGIREAAGRATKIVSNMLQFSRRGDSELLQTSLAAVLDAAVELAANDYDLKKRFDFRTIDLVREYDAAMPDVPAAKIEIEQVILNLLKNAAHAMQETAAARRPRIVLRLRRDATHATIEVEDNGPGLSDEVSRRIFEPFFTTKEPGVGTGLGLSVSYTIITQNHQGSIAVESLGGLGARFTIRLPLQRKEAHA